MGWPCSWVEENCGGLFRWKAPEPKAKVNVVRVDLRLVICQDRKVIDLVKAWLVLKMNAARSVRNAEHYSSSDTGTNPIIT